MAMGRRRPSNTLDTATPFGYTFEHPDEPVSSSSYPPPGPPLLDNNESGILDSFFNNPDDVDPNFLSLQGFQTDHGNLFSNTNVEWAPQNLTALSNSSAILPPNVGQISQSDQGRPLPASADVYAAAGILHNNTARQQIPATYNGYPLDFSSVAQQGTPMNGYGGYGTMSNGRTAEYDFPTGNNSLYNGYDAQHPSTPYVTEGIESKTEEWDGGRPGPLNFGSDDNFRNSYALRTGEAPPDKKLLEALNLNFVPKKETSKRGGKGRSSNKGAARKRARQRAPEEDEEEIASNEDEEGSSGDDARLKRRRQNRIKGDDEDGDFDEQGGKGKRGKKTQPAAATLKAAETSAASSSPASKKQKASAAAAAKERRENLSEEQKRSNHIQSEQKRRNLIKQGFEDLNRMVPELRSSGLSKSNMLVEAAKFMRILRDENDALRAQMESLDKG